MALYYSVGWNQDAQKTSDGPTLRHPPINGPGARTVYHSLTRRRIQRRIDRLAAGDHTAITRGLPFHLEHTVVGDHPLGGERYRSDAVERWFDRLHVLYPHLNFEVHDIVISGWPWRISIAIDWTIMAVPAAGGPFSTRGAHLLTFRLGRLKSLRGYYDSQAIRASCDQMAAAGIAHASDPPILE